MIQRRSLSVYKRDVLRSPPRRSLCQHPRSGWRFWAFPNQRPAAAQRFPRLLFAGCRYARRRSSASKGKLQQACNNHGSAHNDHIGGSWRHQAENQRQKAQRQQEHAINAAAHCPLFARRAFRGVSSDAVYRIPHSGAAPPTLSFQMPVQQFCGFSVHGGIIVVANLKRYMCFSFFETGLLSVSKNSFTAYRTATGQSDML